MSTCPVCDKPRRHVFSATVLQQHRADYVHCRTCGLLQAAQPSWLTEAYESAISAVDTGVAQRNVRMSVRLGGLYGSWFGGHGRYVDVAGGSGLLVRLLRDLGLDAYWTDPYAENLFARGFEANEHDVYTAVSAVEVLEHVEDPLTFLRKCLEDTGARALIFTTELYEGQPPDTDWWYYQFETGQHITFMQRRTLEIIAKELQCRLMTRKAIHALVRDDLPGAPFYAASSRLASAQLAWQRRKWHPLTDRDSEALKRWTS